MPNKKGDRRISKKNIDKRITTKLYKFPKAFRRKTNKNKLKSRSPLPNMCPICLFPFTENNLAILGCGHKFHFRCILKDITKAGSNKQCPLCREPLDGPLPNPPEEHPPSFVPNPPEEHPPSQSNTPPPPANHRLHELQLLQLESVRDRHGNRAYLDTRGIFGYPMYLYDANGEDIGFFIDSY